MQDGNLRRTDSDSDVCTEDNEDLGNIGGQIGTATGRRNSISRVSIRYSADDHNRFFASYNNCD